jgi:hypothetical protein
VKDYSYNLPLTTWHSPLEKTMLRKIYYALGIGVILLYTTSSWLGWEFWNSGQSRSIIGVPFISTGYRGGK